MLNESHTSSLPALASLLPSVSLAVSNILDASTSLIFVSNILCALAFTEDERIRRELLRRHAKGLHPVPAAWFLPMTLSM